MLFVYVFATYPQVLLVEGNFFNFLATQITLYREIGPFCICGDFNPRCGNLDDVYHQNVDIPERQVIKQFIDLLRSMGLYTLNGRGKDNFTYTSSTGRSVVDYCIVDVEDYNKHSSFSVTTMREIIQILDYMRRHLIFLVTRYLHGIWNLKALILTPYVLMGLNKQLNMFPISTYRGYPNYFMVAKSEELLKSAEILQMQSSSQDLLDNVDMDFCKTVKEEMQQKIPNMNIKNTLNIKPWWNTELKKESS